MTAPALSVVMPVHNAMPHLDEAVASILAQTFADFEFVILDDGSTDGSGRRLRDWAGRDARIRLVHAGERLGPAGSSNCVVAEARAPLIARMDADDVAHRGRLRRQFELFEQVPDAVLAGTLWDVIDECGRRIRPPDRNRLLHPSAFAPFVHGSIMYRREAFVRAGGYRRECDFWEDIDLFLRLSATGRVFTLVEPLYSHRISATSTRRSAGAAAVGAAYGRLYRCLERHMQGSDYDDLLREPPPQRIPPAAFALLGSPSVWSGRSPRLLGLLLKRGHLAADRATLSALVWTAWAELSPKSLRLFLSALLAARNRVARSPGDCPWVEWKPPRKCA